MDSVHHTAFLLAILICILLLLLALSSLLMCYWRRHGFIIKNRKSSRFGRLVRDQATSMTSFTLNAINTKLQHNDPKESQAFSLPITVDQSSKKCKRVTSNLSLPYINSHVLNICDEEKGSQTLLINKFIPKKSEASEHYSTLQHILSSGASFLGSGLEKSSMFNLKAKRRSSSLKSGVNVDIAMIPLESPVYESSMNDQFQPTGSSDLSRSSTLLCENSSDQQFTWDTASISILNRLEKNKESFSLPNTLERKIEDDSHKENTQLGKLEIIQPKSWFICLGNRPLSEGAQPEKELNNVTSLDSGVDIIEPAVRNGFGGHKVPRIPISTHDTDCHVPSRSPKENPEENDVDDEKQDKCRELHISHQEAARTLNPTHYSRSLWEKREERPLIGVN
ncbi:uncharacterized protein [Pyxicephalus adspersus]|uniref:uncharacterized protein n=1 Tax=Pyxicephalus adspersus TaxID=30357 RepID=UPI003B5C944D